MKTSKHYLTAIGGILLMALGLFLIKTVDRPQSFLLALPYVCIGIGCGAFGHGVSSLITAKALRHDPVIQKQMEIAQKDERNVTIQSRSKAMAYDFMTYVFGALMLTFALMGVEIIPILLLVFSYLLVQGYAVYCRCKFDREM